MTTFLSQNAYIHPDISQGRITFTGHYRRNAGPLPHLEYKLAGLWGDPDVGLIKAIFHAGKIPVHDGEPIFHRYENNVVHQGQARFRYFTLPGLAGMVLKRWEHPTVAVWSRMSAEANRMSAEEWKAAQTPERLESLRFVEVPDLMGTYAPVIVCLKPTQQEENVS